MLAYAVMLACDHTTQNADAGLDLSISDLELGDKPREGHSTPTFVLGSVHNSNKRGRIGLMEQVGYFGFWPPRGPAGQNDPEGRNCDYAPRPSRSGANRVHLDRRRARRAPGTQSQASDRPGPQVHAVLAAAGARRPE